MGNIKYILVIAFGIGRVVSAGNSNPLIITQEIKYVLLGNQVEFFLDSSHLVTIDDLQFSNFEDSLGIHAYLLSVCPAGN